jgi:hypothetical protein
MDGIFKCCICDSFARGVCIAVAAGWAILQAPTAAVLAQGNSALLHLETKIPLGPVRGRIDHMAVDLKRQRLLVAELGNDSVGVVDLKERKTIHTITDLKEPQGVGYVPSTDTVYVANAGDGSVQMFRGADYAAAGRIDLGNDADNIRVDRAANRILIGYGEGYLSAVDVTQQKKVADFPLPAHPESFQLGRDGRQIFVNVPGAHAIAVLDAATGNQKARWPVREGGNFPMAVDKSTGRVLIVTRNPPRLSVRADQDGSVVASADTCGDADDLFVDAKRGRVYVSCGTGFIDMFETRGTSYKPIGRIATVVGARTSLFVADHDVLLLGVRATATDAAAIWVFKALP